MGAGLWRGHGFRGERPRRSLTWPLIAVCLYAALIPLQPVFNLPDGSALRLAGSEAVAPFVFLAALARPRRRLPPGLAALAIAIPLLALFLTLVTAAGDRDISVYGIGKTIGLFYLVGFCFAVVRATEPGAEVAILRALAWGALWSAVVGLMAFAASLAGIQTLLVNSYASGTPRLCSTMTGDPNIFCSVLAVGLLITAMDRGLSTPARAVRLAILVAAILATGSRSGAVAAVVAIVACTLLSSRDVWVTMARTAVVVLAVAVAATPVLLTRSGTAAANVVSEHLSRTFTVESRFDLYGAAFRNFTDHPLGGLGIGGFAELNSVPRQLHFAVHNTYLWALVDMGLAGGLLLVGLIAAGIWRCVGAAVRRPPADGATVVAAGILAMAAFNLFIDGFYQRHFWVLMACALGMPRPRRLQWRPVWGRSLVPSVARSLGFVSWSQASPRGTGYSSTSSGSIGRDGSRP